MGRIPLVRLIEATKVAARDALTLPLSSFMSIAGMQGAVLPVLERVVQGLGARGGEKR